jgi:translocation and assembly module TamA
VSTRRGKSVIGCLTGLGLALGLGALIAANPALAADPLGYEVELASTGNDDMDSTLKASSQLQTLRSTAPLSPIGLIARARGDIGRLTTVLESFGYYRSAITITINGLVLDDPTLGDVLIALPQDSRAHCKVSFQPGPLYHVGRIDIDGEVPDLARRTMKLSTGAPAVAADVLAAGARLLTALQDQGYAFARVDPPVAYEDPEHQLLNLSFHVVPGARMKVGDISIEGLERMREKTVRRRLLVHTGDVYSAAQVERARKDLLATGVFTSVTAQLGNAPDAQGRVPLTFLVREQRRRAVALNAAYSSDLGGSGGFSWTDRNLLGYADQLTLSASILDLGGTASTGIGYDTSIKYRWQDLGHRDQSLQLALGAIKQSLQAYDQTAETAAITLNRKLSDIWSASVSIVGTHEVIEQETLTSTQKVRSDFNLFAVPFSVLYDTTGLSSPLQDPTRGMRASLSLTPTLSFGQPSAVFLITQLTGASYLDLQPLLGEGPGRTVLALRVLVGVAQGANTFSLPPDQRFYVGGSGTVRGYRYQSIGPKFPSGNPTGGTAFNAVNAELRQRIGRNWGFVVFTDGGAVSYSVSPFSGSFQIGVGAGARYYTPIGALRFDVAVPAGRQAGDDAFEIYIGLGQAF